MESLDASLNRCRVTPSASRAMAAARMRLQRGSEAHHGHAGPEESDEETERLLAPWAAAHLPSARCCSFLHLTACAAASSSSPSRRCLLVSLVALACLCLLLTALLIRERAARAREAEDEPPPPLYPPLAVRVAPLAPLTAACNRSLIFSFTGVTVGLGSKLDQLLTAGMACLREREDRHLFLDDRSWAYVSFLTLFLPSAPLGPELPGWNDALTERRLAVAEQLLWPPLLSVRLLAADSAPLQRHHSTLCLTQQVAAALLPPPSPGSRYGLLRHNATHDLLPRRFLRCSSLSSLLLSPRPPFASLLAANEDEADAEAAAAEAPAVCSPPHASDAYRPPLVAHSMAKREADGYLRYLLQQPHIYAEYAYGYPPTRWYDAAKTAHPEMQLQPQALRLLHELHPHALPAATAERLHWLSNGSILVRYEGEGEPPLLLPAPPLLFVEKQRIFHDLLILRPEYRSQAADVLQRLGWTTRSSLWEAAWRRHSAQAAPVPSASSGSSSRPYLAFHVRRQDKSVEFKEMPLSVFIAAAERVVSNDLQLQQAFGVVSSSSCLPTREANASAEQYAVQLMLLTDDDSTLAELRRLRPCWRVETPFPAEPGMVRKGDGQVAQQSSHWKQEMARRLLVSLVLLTEADYAIVTFSSNIGRLVALARGWVDFSWAGRTVSLDTDWFHIW